MELNVHGIMEQVFAEIIHAKIQYLLNLKLIVIKRELDAHILMKIKYVIKKQYVLHSLQQELLRMINSNIVIIYKIQPLLHVHISKQKQICLHVQQNLLVISIMFQTQLIN